VRARRALVVISAAALTAALLPAAADARKRHLHRPPPPITLWSSLAVNETEWALRPGHLNLRAGRVRVHVYNQGMDDHDLTIAQVGGHIVAATAVKASVNGRAGEAIIQPALRPGRYRLYCSLFRNTPDSHEAKGMVAFVNVY
jgi:hypothetical protein